MTKRTKKKATKKKATKRAPSKLVVTPKDLRPADYNPRVMDEKSKKGLATSMKEFEDISGITWNKTTGNIVTGHHRWENLLDLYGEESLTFETLKNGRCAILADGEDTSYTMRIVEWDEAKEKAANISANSHKLEGQFTDALTNILDDLKVDMEDNVFADLRLDELGTFSFDNDEEEDSAISEDDWDSDIGKIEKTNENNTTMFETISILVSEEEDLAEIKELVMEVLKGKQVEIR